VREVVVLGRAGQRGGRCQSELTVDRDGVPLLAHTLLLDGADPALAGPAGTGGARAIGTLAVVGKGVDKPPEDAGEQPGLRWAYSALEGPGWLLLALGDSPAPSPGSSTAPPCIGDADVDGMGRSPNTYARYSVFRKVNRSIHRPESEATSFPR
jgi:hypothetical protein